MKKCFNCGKELTPYNYELVFRTGHVPPSEIKPENSICYCQECFDTLGDNSISPSDLNGGAVEVYDKIK